MKQKKYALIDIRVPTKPGTLLDKALPVINQYVEIKTLWRITNVNTIDCLEMTDHGPVHFQIVANIANRLVHILVKHKIEMSILNRAGQGRWEPTWALAPCVSQEAVVF